MPHPPTRLAQIFALITVLSAVGGFAGDARADDCTEAISEANTRALFEALKVQKGADGCVLENVHTERSRMEIMWKKGGTVESPIVVTPKSCSTDVTTEGRALSLDTPRGVASDCPDAVATMIQLVKSEAFGGLVQIDIAAAPTAGPAKSKKTWIVAGVGLALVLAASVASVLRKRSGDDEDDEDDEDEEKGEAAAAGAGGDGAKAEEPATATAEGETKAATEAAPPVAVAAYAPPTAAATGEVPPEAAAEAAPAAGATDLAKAELVVAAVEPAKAETPKTEPTAEA